jgi:hypothetical protein
MKGRGDGGQLRATPFFLLAVYLSAMADLENPDLTGLVVDSIKDAILAHSDAPSFLEAATEHLDALGPGGFGKQDNGFVDPFDGMLWELAKVTCCP